MNEGDTIIGLGARTDYVAAVPRFEADRLTPEEQALFSAVGRVSTIQELISRSGLSEPKTIALLLSLRAKGAIAPARVTRESSRSVDAAMLEQVDLEHERKREILDFERALETDHHFELLGVAVDATPEEVKKAYHELSRKFHPDRYFKKNLGSFRSRLERIFKRITEAQNTLMDPAKRAAYLAAHPEIVRPAPRAPSGPQLPPEDPARAAERRARMAHHPYLAKNRKAHDLLAEGKQLLANKNYSVAEQQLQLAAQLDPASKEIQALLAQAKKLAGAARATTELQRAQEAELMGNLAGAASSYRTAASMDPSNGQAAAKAAALLLRIGNDLKEAKAMADAAVQADPENAGYHTLLGKVLLEAGLKKLAKKEFEQAVRLDPGQAEAKSQLRSLRWTF